MGPIFFVINTKLMYYNSFLQSSDADIILNCFLEYLTVAIVTRMHFVNIVCANIKLGEVYAHDILSREYLYISRYCVVIFCM